MPPHCNNKKGENMPVIWNNGRRGVKAPLKTAEEPKAPEEMTVKELKAELDKRGVEFGAKLKKPDLLDLLIKAIDAETDVED